MRGHGGTLLRKRQRLRRAARAGGSGGGGRRIFLERYYPSPPFDGRRERDGLRDTPPVRIVLDMDWDQIHLSQSFRRSEIIDRSFRSPFCCLERSLWVTGPKIRDPPPS